MFCYAHRRYGKSSFSTDADHIRSLNTADRTFQLEGSLDSTHLVAQPVGAGDLGSPTYVMPRLDVSASQLEVHNAFRHAVGILEPEKAMMRCQEISAGGARGCRTCLRVLKSVWRGDAGILTQHITKGSPKDERACAKWDAGTQTGQRLFKPHATFGQQCHGTHRDSRRDTLEKFLQFLDMPSIQLPNHIPNSSRQLLSKLQQPIRMRLHRKKSGNITPKSEHTTFSYWFIQSDVIGSGSSRSRNLCQQECRWRQPNYGDIYHSTNLVTERRSNGPPLISSHNTPRLSRKRPGNGGTSRLTDRSRESNLRLSVPNAHHADRHKSAQDCDMRKLNILLDI